MPRLSALPYILKLEQKYAYLIRASAAAFIFQWILLSRTINPGWTVQLSFNSINKLLCALANLYL